jgi:hypothetical protein
MKQRKKERKRKKGKWREDRIKYIEIKIGKIIYALLPDYCVTIFLF